MIFYIEASFFSLFLIALPDSLGRGVIFKLAIDSIRMLDYEMLESSTSKGKTSLVSGCLETHNREGVKVAQFTAGNCWYPGNSAECTNPETSWSLLESHSFWQRCLWSLTLTSLHLRHTGMP